LRRRVTSSWLAKIGELAVLVVDGANEQRVPERRSVALVVEHLGRDGAAFLHRLADFGHRLAAGHRALQKPAVAAQDLALLVAGKVEKRLVGEHDWIVVLVRIGQDHRHPGHLNCREEHVSALFETGVRDDAFAPMVHPGRAAHRVGLGQVNCAAGRNTAALAATLDIGRGSGITRDGADFV
jgi:hypothetical protein